jgi:serine protease AprX
MSKFKSVSALLAVGLGVASLGGGGVPATAVKPSQNTNWAAWLSGSAGDTATTLKEVRTLIKADTGTAATLTGKGVGVALIDTGVAPVAGLPAASVVNGPDLSLESQASNLRYLDTYGHGTHMAGIIVGKDSATGTTGLAPGVKLTSIKVGTASGMVDVSQVIAAVDWVVEHRNDDPYNPIKVINLSYGSGGTPWTYNDPLAFAVEKAWKAGITVVAAAGNDGAASASLANPAMDEWILSVGASATKGTVSTSDDEMTAFTNQPQSGKPVNILAPGVSIVSLRDTGSYIDVGYPSARVGTTLFKGSGTSQAAAVVSASVALLLQYKPTATPDQVKDWIVKSGTWVPNGIAATSGLMALNVNGAIGRAGTTVVPATWNLSTGNGDLNNARGDSRAVLDGVALSGQRSIWGAMDTAAWAAKSAATDSWQGGNWMGYRVAGDGWTGSSWASKTWAASAWSNSKPWSNSSLGWADPSWSGRAWTGRAWTTGAWTGRAWTGDDWSSSRWG